MYTKPTNSLKFNVRVTRSPISLLCINSCVRLFYWIFLIAVVIHIIYCINVVIFAFLIRNKGYICQLIFAEERVLLPSFHILTPSKYPASPRTNYTRCPILLCLFFFSHTNPRVTSTLICINIENIDNNQLN